MGRGLSTLESCGYTLRHLTEELTIEHSVISLLFQGEHRHVIACGNCHHKSITLEPFIILSLSLPASGQCTLANLLKNYYKECSIDYNCPKRNKGGKCVRRIFIQRLPPILILHLNRFEYIISARKKQNYVDFPLRQLSLGEHALSRANLASYDLCAVSNHYGTTNGGHYTSYCKPPQGDVWYQCDDKTVTRLQTPVKTSTAYLLFHDSIHADIRDLSLVPMVHLLMVWLWSGGLMSAWYLWDGRCSVGEVEYWCSSCDVGVDDVASVGDNELWRWFGPVPLFPVPLLIPYFPKCPPITSRTPSDPVFPKVPSLTPTHLWFSAGAAVHFFSGGWVSLSSKEMPDLFGRLF